MLDPHLPTPDGALASGVQLSARIADGDETAFAEFYASWFAPTLALARAISRRDEAWCLDVVQDVMLTVASKMPKLADGAALRAWMRRVCVNTVTDRSRSEFRQKRREHEVGDADVVVAEPWHQLCDHERQSWLAARLADLSALDQALLEARFGATASVAEVALDLGISSDAAHGRLRRALHKLRQKAAEYWYGT